VLDYEYICDRIAKFYKKILFITWVINIQILTTKYCSFQYSVTYCSQALKHPAHRAHETVHLFTHETPYFITPLCGQPTVLTLTQSPTRFRGSCRSVCTAASFVTSTSWSRAWSKSGNISTRWSLMKRAGSGVHVFELAFDFEHTVDILNTDLGVCWSLAICTDAHFTVNHACAYSGHSCFWLSDLTKLAVAVVRCWQILLKFGDLFAI